MVKKDSRVDAYITKSAVFARPILQHLRQVVHKACPEVEEAIKWNFATFMYQGKILCSMAAFQQHATFGFWRASVMTDPYKFFTHEPGSGMGQLGKMRSLKDLPSNKVLTQYIKEAMRLTEQGVKLPQRSKPVGRQELIVPEYFLKALGKSAKTLKVFESFSYSHKKEYVEWIAEAKTGETRNKRMATALEWIGQGKGRNWKYERIKDKFEI